MTDPGTAWQPPAYAAPAGYPSAAYSAPAGSPASGAGAASVASRVFAFFGFVLLLPAAYFLKYLKYVTPKWQGNWGYVVLDGASYALWAIAVILALIAVIRRAGSMVVLWTAFLTALASNLCAVGVDYHEFAVFHESSGQRLKDALRTTFWIVSGANNVTNTADVCYDIALLALLVGAIVAANSRSTYPAGFGQWSPTPAYPTYTAAPAYPAPAYPAPSYPSVSCRRCGAAAPPGATVCTSCGTPFGSDAANRV